MESAGGATQLEINEAHAKLQLLLKRKKKDRASIKRLQQEIWPLKKTLGAKRAAARSTQQATFLAYFAPRTSGDGAVLDAGASGAGGATEYDHAANGKRRLRDDVKKVVGQIAACVDNRAGVLDGDARGRAQVTLLQAVLKKLGAHVGINSRIVDSIKGLVDAFKAEFSGRFPKFARKVTWALAAAVVHGKDADDSLRDIAKSTGINRMILAKAAARLDLGGVIAGAIPFTPDPKTRSDKTPQWVLDMIVKFWDENTRASERMSDEVSDVHELRGKGGGRKTTRKSRKRYREKTHEEMYRLFSEEFRAAMVRKLEQHVDREAEYDRAPEGSNIVDPGPWRNFTVGPTMFRDHMPHYVKEATREQCQCASCLRIDLLIKAIAIGRQQVAHQGCNCGPCTQGLDKFSSALQLRALSLCEKADGQRFRSSKCVESDCADCGLVNLAPRCDRYEVEAGGAAGDAAGAIHLPCSLHAPRFWHTNRPSPARLSSRATADLPQLPAQATAAACRRRRGADVN